MTCNGGANPTAESAPRTGKRGCRQMRSAMPSGVSGPCPRHEPSMRRPRAARWRRTRFHWPTCPSNQRRRAPSGSRCHSPLREGPRNQRNAPCVQTSTTQAGQCWNTWRGTPCTLQPRWTTRRRPPTSCKGGHGGPHGTPHMLGAPRPRRPTTQTAMRRHPGRPRGPAVRPNKGPSPRGWPPRPSPVGPAGNGLSTPHGPGAPRSPGCTSGPGGDADAGWLTPGGHGGRRPMAPLVEPAQRPRTARPVTPGHALAAPGAGGL